LGAGRNMKHYENLELSDLPGEQWRPAQGWEESYAVSTLGRVKSLERTVKNRYGFRTVPEAIKKQTVNNTGYLVVSFTHPSTGKKSKVQSVHTLVAAAFLDPPEASASVQVQHIDGDRTNNILSNLAYATVSEILLAASARGSKLGSRGEQSGTAKVTEADVREMRRLSEEEGVSGAALARRYGLSPMSVSDILRRKNWKHVE